MNEAASHLEQSLMLVLPLPVYELDGNFHLDRQACNGLRLWLKNFRKVSLLCPVVRDRPPIDDTLPVTVIEDEHRLEILPLPVAYTPAAFLRALPTTKRVLRATMLRSTHLQFAIGGIWGDWGSVAALVAYKLRLPFAVWTDRVESEVIRSSASSKFGIRKAYTKAYALLTRHYERSVIRRSSLGLFHGMDCYEAYALYSSSPHLVHDVHLGPDKRISSTEIDAKCLRGQDEVVQIAYAGRAHREKGIYDWIDALAVLDRAGGRFQAAWYGDGPEFSQALQYAEQKRFKNSVMFQPRIDHLELIRRLRVADIFLFCHKTPESPRCLIEALISGTPIVGYSTAYSENLIAVHSGGVLTPQHDIQRLGQALTSVALDRSRLRELAVRAAGDGRPFTDEAVFRHRSDLIKSIPTF
jgi:colanic acid/amylovoran biosynthesis glycosyltransferase